MATLEVPTEAVFFHSRLKLGNIEYVYKISIPFGPSNRSKTASSAARALLGWPNTHFAPLCTRLSFRINVFYNRS